MAEDLDQESKTEDPSPHRREEAAEKGQFAFSTELSAGLVVLVGIGALAYLGPALAGGLLNETRNGLSVMPSRDLPVVTVQSLFGGLFQRAGVMLSVFFGLLVAVALAANFAQVGIRINTERMAIDWERVSLVRWDRLIGWSKLMRGLALLVKIVAVAAVAWWILRNRAGEFANLGDTSLAAALSAAWGIVIRLALGMAGTLLVIGVVDYGWQYWQFERSLKMTRQELKDELKKEEGDPLIKARMRRMQRDIAQRKMFLEIPKATVVVTNPTHLAVALRYDAGSMAAPKVVAKGAGHVAKRIVAMARRHGVPVLERKPLARTLFKTVRLDKEVPSGLYLIIAEVLAHVYRLKGVPIPRTSGVAPAARPSPAGLDSGRGEDI